MDPIICIVGPTASGKTSLAVALAKELEGEIVSCDSMQLYRGMDIGTAKPSPAEQGGIRHHMFDVAEPTVSFSVSRYVELADECVQDILRRGKRVILAGGTGLYLDSLIAGRQFAPFPQTGRREELCQIAREQGISVLYEQLRQVDPDAAARIAPQNEKRVIRALEVYLETGKTISQHDLESKTQPPKYSPLWIGLDYVNRSALYARIDRRVEEMLQNGLVQEVEGLLACGVPASATAMQAIGYKELTGYLAGECSLEAACAQIQQASRRYAKRQRTWFRRNEKIHWLLLPDEPELAQMKAQALALWRDFSLFS